MREDNPCHGCEERWVIGSRSCHSVCKRWLKRRQRIDAENEARRAAEKERNDAIGFAVDSARKTIRDQNHCRKL